MILFLRLVIPGLICSLFYLSAPAFGDQEANMPPDIRRIKERGTLIVAMYRKDVKPFMFHDKEGNFIGHEVKLAKDIAQALGVELVFDRSPKTFNCIINLVAEEKADMAISLISRTLTRARKVRFSKPYIILRRTLLMNRLTVSNYNLDTRDPIESLKAFSGKIGEKAATSYVNIAGDLFPQAEIVEYPEWLDVMNGTRNQEVGVALRDEIGVKNYMAEFPEQSIQLQMINLEDARYADSLAIALPAASVHLQEWVNLFFDVNGVTGNADNLLEQYREYYE